LRLDTGAAQTREVGGEKDIFTASRAPGAAVARRLLAEREATAQRFFERVTVRRAGVSGAEMMFAMQLRSV
jgi:hypothetical protein